MTKEKQKIIDYAKKLYTSYDSEGRKEYSLREIEKKILQKYNKKITHTTVREWSNKYDWNKINEKIKQQGIQKAKDEKFSVDEQIIEKESDVIAEIYKYAEQGMKIGYREIFQIFKKGGVPISDTSVRDLIALVKMNTDIIFRINEIPEKSDTTTQIIFQNVSKEFDING